MLTSRADFEALLGSIAFGPVQADLNGNIKKLRARHDMTTDRSQTVQALVQCEHCEKKTTATEGLLWLTR